MSEGQQNLTFQSQDLTFGEPSMVASYPGPDSTVDHNPVPLNYRPQVTLLITEGVLQQSPQCP